MIESNYIVVQGWMIESLGLKGNELLTFALIYGFSQDGNAHRMSLSYVQKWLGASRPTTIKAIRALEKKKLIIKSQKKGQKGKENYYQATGKETLPPTSKETLPVASKETLHNKYEEDISRDKANDTDERVQRTPTLDQIETYCQERLNGVNAQKFLDYYQATDWRKGGQKITDWKALVRYWETGNQDEEIKRARKAKEPKQMKKKLDIAGIVGEQF